MSDVHYARCLAKIQDHVRMHKLQSRFDRGAGVRSTDDRDRAEKYGAERERYNGKVGGRVFKWYSRVVFNNYLVRMGGERSELYGEGVYARARRGVR